MKLIDLHMHTTHSDGSYTPAELLRYCRDKNLACVSVTDHDTMSGFEECDQEAKRLRIELIAGIEVSVQFGPGTLHILGYFLDARHPELKKNLEEIQRARCERNPLIIEKLNREGIEITLEEVEQTAYTGKPIPKGRQLGRPHFAKALLKKGIVKTAEEAFDRFLSKGRAAYVDKRRISSRGAIEMIRKAGGIASVAHPKQMRLDPEAMEKEVVRLKEEGLEAIEVYNSCQKPEDNRLYLNLAKRLDLIPTGGSDFHGIHKPGVDLGYLGEGVRLGYEIIEPLKKRVGR